MPRFSFRRKSRAIRHKPIELVASSAMRCQQDRTDWYLESNQRSEPEELEPAALSNLKKLLLL